MQKTFLLSTLAFVFACHDQTISSFAQPTPPTIHSKSLTDKDSWAYFLQHLPEKQSPVLDYKGNPVSNQAKHAAIIDYDTGNKDLQQCADALMRLWAEYLFSQKRLADIHFHFVSGLDYSFLDYCKGKRPVVQGNNVRFVYGYAVDSSHQSLRRYLDIVYAYASTISLAREMRPADDFAVGTVVIYPGSPGHCFIISDEAILPDGDKAYKLVEGYTPAQSIYVLQNVNEPELGPWHRLSKGTIETASCIFTSYQLRKFE